MCCRNRAGLDCGFEYATVGLLGPLPKLGCAFLFRCGNRLRYRFLFTIIGNTCQSGTAARYQLNAGEVFQDQAPMIALAFEQCVTSGFGYWRVLTDYIALRWISSVILGFLSN